MAILIMGYILEESIFEVLGSNDIYEVVSEYLPLKRAGSYYKALCPFHTEKTPSFFVNPQKQIFKCFGCQKGGNVFTFVMEMERISFQEAVKLLAEKSGVKLRFSTPQADVDPLRKKLFELNRWAAEFFRRTLLRSRDPRRYLRERGLSEESSELFLLGFSPPGWDELYVSARKEGFDEETLLSAGLIQRRSEGRGFYDLFRGRLMFPIFDPRGRVIGFGARSMGAEEPKYLNTPQGPIFNKGANLYGFHLAKDHLRSRHIYLVEGYFDLILAHQHGIKNTSATLGTALTLQQIGLLKRHVDKITLVYDPDPGGREASERALQRLLSEEIEAEVIRLPEGKDPSDILSTSGREALEFYLKRPVEIFGSLMESYKERFDLSTTYGKTKFIRKMLEFLGGISNKLQQGLLLQRLAREFSLDERILQTNMVVYASKDIGVEDRPLEPYEKEGIEVIELMLFENSLIPMAEERINYSEFPEKLREILEKIYKLYHLRGRVEGAELISLLDDPQQSSLIADILQKQPPEDPHRRFEGLLRTRLAKEPLPNTLREKIKGSGDLSDEELKSVELLALRRNRARYGG
jgi:DNA primase